MILYKRIFNELKEICFLGYDILVNDNSNCDFKEKTCNKIIISKNNIEYTFFIDNCYPFEPPYEILINNKKIENIYKIDSSKIMDFLKKEYNIHCFLCSSLICKNNWKPKYKMIDIVGEVEKIDKIKNNLIKLIIFEKIKEKFKCYFFNIRDYIDFDVYI